MTRSGRKTLLISPGVPDPARGASRVLFYHYAERFRREGDRVLHLLLLQPGDHTDAELAAFEHAMAEPGRYEIVACRSERPVVRFGRVGFDIDLSSAEGAVGRVRAFEPDVTICMDLLATMLGRRIGSRPAIAWLGDLNFVTQWYHWVYSAREDPLRIRHLPAAVVRTFLWKRRYREALRGMDRIIVSSRSSEDHLKALGLSSTYLPYPWPEEGGGATPGTRPAQPTFVFLGNLVGLGSRSALHLLLGPIHHACREAWGRGGFRIVIAGSGALPERSERALARLPEIRYLGFVDDLAALLGSCHAMLAPIEVPVGNRSRILTAMAQRVPVIAHRNAALGNPDLVDGATCYLASTAAEFVERMRRAVERREEVAAIVARARAVYEARFAPQAATGLFLAEVDRVLERRLPAANGRIASVTP